MFQKLLVAGQPVPNGVVVSVITEDLSCLTGEAVNFDWSLTSFNGLGVYAFAIGEVELKSNHKEH